MDFEIRRPRATEHDRIHRLVSEVVNETYGSIWPTVPIQVDEEDWGAGWVAAAAGNLMGWMLTWDCWVEDVWVSSRFHDQGVGSAFPAQGEREIAARGIGTAHLYVISSNVRAIAFYQARGWRLLQEVPHEILSIPRLELIKDVA